MPAQCCIDRWNRLMHEDPDMPVFTLLAQDDLAIDTVKYWLELAKLVGVKQEKIDKVKEHLDAMEKYRIKHPNRLKKPD